MKIVTLPINNNNQYKFRTNKIAPSKQFLSIKEIFIWYAVKEKTSLNWRKFCWFKKICFNVNKTIPLDLSNFFWINKAFFNSKKFFLWSYIKEMFLWFKEIVFWVCSEFPPSLFDIHFWFFCICEEKWWLENN